MRDEAAELAQQKAREEREADLVANRIRELRIDPIKGDFDANHLKAVHAYIFQDLPHHQPGVMRDDTAETWVKHRALEGRPVAYDVPYVSQDVEDKIATTLEQFGGPEAIKGLAQDTAAARIAELYSDLDYAHGFYEGNSRTLREFTRELAAEAGFALDWAKLDVGAEERNELYVARDLAVLERAFPNLTPETAMQTDDRTEYEASFVIEGLKRAVGDRPLEAIIRESLSFERQLERGNEHEAATEHGHELDSAVAGIARFAEGVADMAGNAVGALADGLADLFGGSSGGLSKEIERPPPVPDKQPLVQDHSTRQTENEHVTRRAQLFSNLDREVPQEIERDAEIDRDRSGRER
ncbi:Fic family protein [Bradyrhizobium genosp. A]|uniref:Fic family protein n=1 Tax=Bradyrhizobium genosp. A TaxID=83626 RepID=UPI003CEC55F5